MYSLLIDANVWIKYARAKNISPLLDRFVAYRFLPVTNNYLLAEIFDALLRNKWMDEKQAGNLISFTGSLKSFPFDHEQEYRLISSHHWRDHRDCWSHYLFLS